MKLIRTYLEECEDTDCYALIMDTVNFVYLNRGCDFSDEMYMFKESNDYFDRYCKVPMFKELNRIVKLCLD